MFYPAIAGRCAAYASVPMAAFVVTNSARSDRSAVARRDGERRLELHGHTETIGDANFSPDGRPLVTASIDRTARIWDPVRCHLHRPFAAWRRSGRPSLAPTAAMSSRQDVSRSHASFWWSRGAAAELRGHSGVLSTASFSPDGQLLVTAFR